MATHRVRGLTSCRAFLFTPQADRRSRNGSTRLPSPFQPTELGEMLAAPSPSGLASHKWTSHYRRPLVLLNACRWSSASRPSTYPTALRRAILVRLLLRRPASA